MELEGTVTAPITVSPFLAVIKSEAVILPPKEASLLVNKRPFNDKSSLILKTLVVRVLIILLFVNCFTVRFPTMVILPPMAKFPFMDESPDTKSFPLREESLPTTASPAFKVCSPEDTI